jgi:hypothetical protein
MAFFFIPSAVFPRLDDGADAARAVAGGAGFGRLRRPNSGRFWPSFMNGALHPGQHDAGGSPIQAYESLRKGKDRNAL